MKDLLKNKTIYITSIIAILLDQIIKYIVEIKMTLYQSITIIKNFFYISFVKNIGAAFNILSGSRIILLLFGILVTILIYIIFIKGKELNTISKVIYGLLIGGIIGNMLDRIFRGYVVDYLDFYIFKYNYPVFNLADILIVCSIFMIIIWILRGDDNENRNR